MRIKIKINNEVVGSVDDKNDAISYLLSLFAEDVKYYSYDGIRKRLKTILEIAKEIVEWEPIKYGYRKRILNLMKTLETIHDDKLYEFYFNMLLKFEGLNVKR